MNKNYCVVFVWDEGWENCDIFFYGIKFKLN